MRGGSNVDPIGDFDGDVVRLWITRFFGDIVSELARLDEPVVVDDVVVTEGDAVRLVKGL